MKKPMLKFNHVLALVGFSKNWALVITAVNPIMYYIFCRISLKHLKE